MNFESVKSGLDIEVALIGHGISGEVRYAGGGIEN